MKFSIFLCIAICISLSSAQLINVTEMNGDIYSTYTLDNYFVYLYESYATNRNVFGKSNGTLAGTNGTMWSFSSGPNVCASYMNSLVYITSTSSSLSFWELDFDADTQTEIKTVSTTFNNPPLKTLGSSIIFTISESSLISLVAFDLSNVAANLTVLHSYMGEDAQFAFCGNNLLVAMNGSVYMLTPNLALSVYSTSNESLSSVVEQCTGAVSYLSGGDEDQIVYQKNATGEYLVLNLTEVHSQPGAWFNFNDSILYMSWPSEYTMNLIKIDAATGASTQLYSWGSIYSFSGSGAIDNENHLAFFIVSNIGSYPEDIQLWMTDGTAANTKELRGFGSPIDPNTYTTYGGPYFFNNVIAFCDQILYLYETTPFLQQSYETLYATNLQHTQSTFNYGSLSDIESEYLGVINDTFVFMFGSQNDYTTYLYVLNTAAQCNAQTTTSTSSTTSGTSGGTNSPTSSSGSNSNNMGTSTTSNKPSPTTNVGTKLFISSFISFFVIILFFVLM